MMRFQHHRVSREECRANFPAHDKYRHVPGNDSSADTERLAYNNTITVRPKSDCFAILPGRHTGIEFKDVCIPLTSSIDSFIVCPVPR